MLLTGFMVKFGCTLQRTVDNSWFRHKIFVFDLAPLVPGGSSGGKMFKAIDYNILLGVCCVAAVTAGCLYVFFKSRKSISVLGDININCNCSSKKLFLLAWILALFLCVRTFWATGNIFFNGFFGLFGIFVAIFSLKSFIYLKSCGVYDKGIIIEGVLIEKSRIDEYSSDGVGTLTFYLNDGSRKSVFVTNPSAVGDYIGALDSWKITYLDTEDTEKPTGE